MVREPSYWRKGLNETIHDLRIRWTPGVTTLVARARDGHGTRDTVDLIKGNRTRVGRTCPREEVNQQPDIYIYIYIYTYIYLRYTYIYSDYLPGRYYRLILCAYASN